MDRSEADALARPRMVRVRCHAPTMERAVAALESALDSPDLDLAGASSATTEALIREATRRLRIAHEAWQYARLAHVSTRIDPMWEGEAVAEYAELERSARSRFLEVSDDPK